MKTPDEINMNEENAFLLREAAKSACAGYYDHLSAGGKGDPSEERWIEALIAGANSLAYIRQLEAGLAEWGDVCASPGGYEDLARENNELLEKIEQLKSAYGQVSKALCGKENATAEEVIAVFDQVKRERDAAVMDIESSQCCSVCEYCPDNEKCEANYFYCLDCTETDCKCKDCNWGDKLKWRAPI